MNKEQGFNLLYWIGVIIFTFVFLIIFTFVFLSVVTIIFYESPETCTIKFSQSLDDIRYLDNGKIVYVFGNIWVQGEMPKNDLLVKGEYMNVFNCTREGLFGLNKQSYMKVEEAR